MRYLVNTNWVLVRWCDRYIGGFPWISVWRSRAFNTINVALWRLHVGVRYA